LVISLFKAAFLAFVWVLFLPELSHAASVNKKLDVSGKVALQFRGFTQDALWSNQNSSDTEYSFAGELEVRWSSHDGNQQVSFIPFVRWDENDKKRSHYDLREAYWSYKSDDVKLLLGVNKVFWGVAESAHLVDIINQTDLVENTDQEDKLGQPMANLAFQKDWGLLNFYLLPYFRERSFSGEEGRFRTQIPANFDDAKYESGSKRRHLDFAFRYSHYFGEVDLGLHYFKGTSRDPRLEKSFDNLNIFLKYDQIEQIGLDLQYTKDAWLWKLEALVRDGYDKSIFATVAGLEYTFYQIFEGVSDIGVLVEYQYDNRPAYEAVTTADNDMFIGTRWTSNNMQDGSVLAGVIVDKKTSETFYNIEAKTRFKENIVLELEVRLTTQSGLDEPSYAYSQDDYVQLQINRFF